MNLASCVKRILELSDEAAAAGEVPVASMIVGPKEPSSNFKSALEEFIAGNGSDFFVLAESSNRIIEKRDPTTHSEMEAIRLASSARTSERIPDSVLITTLEPCTMCTGAVIHARISAVVYLAKTDKGPGMSDLLTLEKDWVKKFNHHPELMHLEGFQNEAAGKLSRFFQSRRQNNKFLDVNPPPNH